MTAIDRSIILVVDVEATCWNTADTEPPRYSEIIEIGAAQVSMKERRLLKFGSVLVKPERSAVSPFCTELTTLTQEQVDAGLSFKAACQWLSNNFAAERHPWMSDAVFDRTRFVEQCRDYGVNYPFSNEHINLATLIKKHVGNGQRMSTLKALTKLRETMPGRVVESISGAQHRAGNDALNAARLFHEIADRFLSWGYPTIGIHYLDRVQETSHRLANNPEYRKNTCYFRPSIVNNGNA